MHTHERPYLFVAATPMHLKMTAPDGRSLLEEVKPGDFHWDDAKVTHALAQFSGHVLDGSPCLYLLQSTDHLRFRVPAPRHTPFPFRSRKSYSALCRKGGSGQRPHQN